MYTINHSSVQPVLHWPLGRFVQNVKQHSRDGLLALAKILLQFSLGCLLVAALSFWPYPLSQAFFSVFSAGLALVYLASLWDVRYWRDAVSISVPALVIFGLLAWDHHNSMIIGMVLFSHALIAFFSAFSQRSGSLKELGLWPLLLGMNTLMFIVYSARFIAE